MCLGAWPSFGHVICDMRYLHYLDYILYILYYCLIEVTLLYLHLDVFYIYSGNPKRFHSQDVLRFSGQQTTKIKDLSGPVEDIETEAQRQLKTLLDKQLRTQTTLKE